MQSCQPPAIFERDCLDVPHAFCFLLICSEAKKKNKKKTTTTTNKQTNKQTKKKTLGTNIFED